MTRKFSTGKLVSTPGALAVLQAAEVDVFHLLLRHVKGDWGDLDPSDKQANEMALENGARLLSSYDLPIGEKVWVITEADRSSTCVLLPSEY